jgi:Ca2+-transporting ATPase
VALGRATTGNIRKVLRYLVSTNLSESLVMLAGAGLGLPEPLSPMQLLWLNLLSDVAPALALGLDPPEGNELLRPPRDMTEPLLGADDLARQAREGAVIAGATLLAQILAGGGPANAPVAFHAITLAQLLHALACRSEHESLVSMLRHGRRNDALLAAVGGGLVLQLAAQVLPPLRGLLGLGPLSLGGVVAVGFAGIGALAANEAISAAARIRHIPQGLARTDPVPFGHATLGHVPFEDVQKGTSDAG